jgi:hypothetical protein
MGGVEARAEGVEPEPSLLELAGEGESRILPVSRPAGVQVREVALERALLVALGRRHPVRHEHAAAAHDIGQHPPARLLGDAQGLVRAAVRDQGGQKAVERSQALLEEALLLDLAAGQLPTLTQRSVDGGPIGLACFVPGAQSREGVAEDRVGLLNADQGFQTVRHGRGAPCHVTR